MRFALGYWLVFTLVPLVRLQFLDVDYEVQEQCVQKCPMKNHTEVHHYDESYGSHKQCEDGCRLWKSALNSSCQAVCNGIQETLSAKELYCIIGCNDAVNRYYNELRRRLGTPPPPALVADSLTATSLRLEWNFPEARHAGLRYFLQWRYEEHAETWQYCRNQSWGPQDTVFVDNLQPYTKYRFRVALILSNLTDPIVSPSSVVISTRAAGVPASPPIIVRAVPVDSTRISVSWEPGPFPHGPLLSYVLRITDNQPHGYSALKDLPAENNFYMFKNLTPNRNYYVSISMRNGIGPGPPAHVSIATPREHAAKNSEKPVLILGTHHMVLEQGTEMLDEPVILYTTDVFITGLAIHVSKRLLFVSDSARYVHRMPLYMFTNSTNTNTAVLTPSQMNFIPLDLSMDWLNEQLYILGEVTHQPKAWQIARSNLDGRGLTVAVAGLMSKPHHVEVDPYNGYLFWVTKVGLYRLDLADISNGIKHEVKPELILAESNLGAFTVDHTNFRLLVSNQNRNTINSVSLDGKEVLNMRQKIITPRLQKVVSLALANNKFYWTDGNEVLFEEDHPTSDSSYFHNSYPLQISKYYIKVLVNLTSSQPVPVPVNPPTFVQAIFGNNIAKTAWQMPHLLGGQGKGAWQNWSYEISIKNLKIHNTSLIRDINSTSFKIHNLNEDTEYIIKTAAYTSFGKGPPSTEFVGRTLRINKDGKQPVILWSTAESLLKSDASGENVETAIHKSIINDYFFTNMAWYEDQLYLVTNKLQIWWYNMRSHKHGILNEIDSAGSIAIDWIGKKMYWSNPKQQLIIRGNLNGSQQEPLPISPTMAKDLSIDSIKGYLYWSTGLSVECAHLNGGDRIILHQAEYYSGKQVVGLTLDMDHNFVYWIVQGLNGSDLFKARMAGSSGFVSGKSTFVAIKQPNIKGPLCYFNNRLIWLKNNESAVISDLRGQYMASIRGNSLLGLNMIYVMDSSHNKIPNATKYSSIKGISVIPELIDKHSIEVIGTWESFNVTWKPVQNVNYGTVFYEIKIDNFSRNDSKIVTTYPSVKYLWSVMPYTKLFISIRAFTYWGAAPNIRIEIHSPPSTPSAPKNPRTFVTHEHHDINQKKINITYRWDPPSNSNGIVKGYKVIWWFMEGKKMVNDSDYLVSDEREIIIGNLTFNTTYFLQVQAFTEIGDGDLSQITEVNTNTESPIPNLLVAASEFIYIQDMDTNENFILMHGITAPTKLGYLLDERKVFWINDMQELLVLNLDNMNRSKLYNLDGKALSLTVDWVERSIYYIQKDEVHTGCAVYKLNLNYADRAYVKTVQIFRTPFMINEIEISPFTRKLYWIESDAENKYNRLMQANPDGGNMTSFFSENTRHKREVCNCPIHQGIEKPFAIDHSDITNRPRLIFIDSTTKDMLTADRNGCKCEVLLKSKTIGEGQIESIKSDFDFIYWMSRGRVYSIKKNQEESPKNNEINATDILIFGYHMQPYPKNECLIPTNNGNIKVSLLNLTSNTLTVKMPDYQIHSECGNISMASIEYKIYYMPYTDDNEPRCDESCTQEITFNETVVIRNLRPYSKYVFSVALSNYYSDKNVAIGPGIVFQTAAGAPSPPRNVDVTVLNPTLVKVSWLPPRELNGDYVHYEIHWQTEAYISGVRQKGEQTVMENNLNDSSKYSTFLNKLAPNETYSIWVRAYSQTNETSNNSKIIKVKTFPEPSNITLVASTAFKMLIQWNVSGFVEKYVVQYALLTSHDWKDLNSTEQQERSIFISIDELKPKTQYKFRLCMKYPQYENIYEWPKDARFTFETLGDRPSPPGMPIIQHLQDDMYQVWWEASKENGGSIEIYMLETLKTPNYRNKRSTNRTVWNSPHIEEPDFEWESIYNGTDTFWKISGLTDDYRYAFRVSALNIYGWSDFSEESIQFDPTTAAQLAEKQDIKYLIIAISVPIFIVLIFLLLLKCCKTCCTKNKKDQLAVIAPRGPDVELATLRELPRRVNFIHNTNVLYISTQPTPDEITLLPHIRRDQITLMKFLGSGAFGEVFEGKAKGLCGSGGETKVAVKTLRKGASEQEKNEFLQEAQLMSHFKHEHILQLLGVCLDNDPHFIIMELMQGGDLLTYLRSSRKSGMNTPPLNLIELLKMCVDVAKGCRYLEEMHFVHRDLACRNCLVSSPDPESRIVKIGDFGLARDIYKNDYYRKEGEGLLPVRWMAPESLVDGVFTCQSDVWAFGVLLWEIMTLGQQPYPARNNLEVLHYVRRGGRLGKPTDCPETLYQLMLSCWSYEPESRPTFKYCLDAVERLHLKTVNSPMTGAHIGQYISTVPQQMDGISNQAYFQDENHNTSGASWKSGSEEDSSRERTPFLPNEAQPTETPKYLELLYDSDCPVENDGYEIPRTTLSSLKSEPEVNEKAANESDSFNKVVNDLTSIEYLLKDNNVGYTNMNIEQNGSIKTSDKVSS